MLQNFQNCFYTRKKREEYDLELDFCFVAKCNNTKSLLQMWIYQASIYVPGRKPGWLLGFHLGEFRVIFSRKAKIENLGFA